MNSYTATSILNRFVKDVGEINEYVDFMTAQCLVHWYDVTRMNERLSMYSLPLLFDVSDFSEKNYLTPTDVDKLVIAINRVTPYVESMLDGMVKNNAEPDIPLHSTIGMNSGLFNDWLAYALQELPDDPDDNEYSECEQRLLQGIDTSSTDEDGLTTIDQLIIANEAIRYVKCNRVSIKMDILGGLLVQFKRIASISKMMGCEAVVGIQRQGFILLMTAFDAAIFDLVRLKLNKDFFNLIGSFGKNEKISLQEFEDAGSIDVLRNKIINEQLKKRYVRDLISILQNEWNVDCVGPEHKSERLIEIILRRNIHVHNRGIVDQRYLDERRNLDNFNIGDIARVDDGYWRMANDVCLNCVQNVSIWAGE